MFFKHDRYYKNIKENLEESGGILPQNEYRKHYMI